tara:strand:+ start:439 stop:654 length:216 start_codon:yes stop_codon:yes gene_type:complete
MYQADSNNNKKQKPKQITFQNPAFVPVFSTDAAAKVTNPAKGTMTFSSENGHGDIFVWNGSAWKKAELVAG